MDIYKYEDKVIIDDYAHHPTEIKSIIDTIDSNYQDKETSKDSVKDSNNTIKSIIRIFNRIF